MGKSLYIESMVPRRVPVVRIILYGSSVTNCFSYKDLVICVVRGNLICLNQSINQQLYYGIKTSSREEPVGQVPPITCSVSIRRTLLLKAAERT